MDPEFKFAVRDDIEDKDRFLPTKATPTDTGWDVCCAEPGGVDLNPFEQKCIRLGFRMFAPPGWWLELRPRSSTHAKRKLSCLYGVIDEGYENEVLLSCQYIPPIMEAMTLNGDIYWGAMCELHIAYGDRIGQVRPVRRENMLVTHVTSEEFGALCKSRQGERGTGGFGSTG